MKMNYQKELDCVLENLGNRVPKLLLHSCCAPCSSYVLQYLSHYFEIVLFYYNPNIEPASEYQTRVAEQKRLLQEMTFFYPVSFLEGQYEPSRYHEIVRGMENCPEGGQRCRLCFQLRLEEAAQLGKKLCCDYFTTTLTISPLKNAQTINEIGQKMGEKYDVNFLPSDFKKKEGYKKSIQLSKEYGLYRQDYCGCVYSRRKADDKI